jgi:hypothetical protein
LTFLQNQKAVILFGVGAKENQSVGITRLIKAQICPSELIKKKPGQSPVFRWFRFQNIFID